MQALLERLCKDGTVLARTTINKVCFVVTCLPTTLNKALHTRPAFCMHCVKRAQCEADLSISIHICRMQAATLESWLGAMRWENSQAYISDEQPMRG